MILVGIVLLAIPTITTAAPHAVILPIGRPAVLRAERRVRAQLRRRCPPARPGLPGLSLLEAAAIGPRTEVIYTAKLRSFLTFCLLQHEDWHDDAGWDALLARFMNRLFLDGFQADEGQKLIAAVGHAFPRYTKAGMGFLPRSLRCLRGWAKLAPARQRLPMPKVIMFALVGGLLHLREVLMALFMIVAFSAYLRPCEGFALLVRHLVPPAIDHSSRQYGLLLNDAELGIAGKTGMMDEAVQLDDLDYLQPIFDTILQRRNATEQLFNFSPVRLRDHLKVLTKVLGLEALEPNLYALRHGGASEDLRLQRRSALEVQLRGRWRSVASLKRYGKATRLTTQLNKIRPNVIEFGQKIQSDVVRYLVAAANVDHKQALPALPVPQGRKRPAQRSPTPL